MAYARLPETGDILALTSRRGPAVLEVIKTKPGVPEVIGKRQRETLIVTIAIERIRDGEAERIEPQGLSIVLDQQTGILLRAQMDDVPLFGSVSVELDPATAPWVTDERYDLSRATNQRSLQGASLR